MQLNSTYISHSTIILSLRIVSASGIWSCRLLWSCDRLDLLLHSSKMSVTGILNNLDQLTSTSLKHLKIRIDDILRNRRQECNDSYIHPIKNFCSDQTLLDIVLAECEAIFNKSNSKSNKVTTSWLGNENIEYSYSHTNTLKSMKKLSDFPGICRLMDKINSCTEVSGVMDCCLAMRYSSNRSNLRPHADNENEIIDQDASICSFFSRVILNYRVLHGRKNP